METTNEKSTRGGRREGAGRKQSEIKRSNITVRLSPEGRSALERYAKDHGLSLGMAIETVFLSLK